METFLGNAGDVVIYALLFIVLILTLWIIRLELKLKKFFRGKKAESFEENFLSILSTLKQQEHQNAEFTSMLENIDTRVKKSVRGVETIRFSPFKGSGGNQSFATAFITEEGDGVVISSLYSRERFSAFAKPIKRNIPEFELSKEETEVLHKAKERLK